MNYDADHLLRRHHTPGVVMSHGHDHKDLLLLDALRMMWKNAATTPPGAHVGSETLRQEAGVPAVGAEEKGVVVGACRSCCCW
jgi:hypothetical protein